MDIQWWHNFSKQLASDAGKKIAPAAFRNGGVLTASVLETTQGTDAIVSFEGFKAFVRLPESVPSGQRLQIRIAVAKGQNPILSVIPEQEREMPPDHGRPMRIRLFEPISDKPLLSGRSIALTPGALLEGRVTGFEKAGLHLVDFGRFRAFAKVQAPVRQGTSLSFAIKKGTQGTFLQSVSPITNQKASVRQPVSPSIATATRTPAEGASAQLPPPRGADLALLREQMESLLRTGENPAKEGSTAMAPAVEAALVNLGRALETASPTGDVATLARRIRNFVENAGPYFEKRLERAIQGLSRSPEPMAPDELARQPAIRHLMANDLKPNLMILKQFLDALPPEPSTAIDRQMIETMQRVVSRTLAHIEHQQQSATQRPADPDLFQAFTHTMVLADAHQDARLKIYYAKKNRRAAQAKQPRISLLLEMNRMGSVRTDLWMVDRNLNISFFVQNEMIKKAIQAEQHRIGLLLDDAFATVHVKVVVNEKKIAEFEGEALTGCQHRQLDVTV